MFVNNLGVVVGTVITYATYAGSDGGTIKARSSATASTTAPTNTWVSCSPTSGALRHTTNLTLIVD